MADSGPTCNDLSNGFCGSSSTAITRQQNFSILGTSAIKRVPWIVSAHFLWAISPKYEGAVKVTGEQLDGSNELRFNAASGFPGEKLTALEFDESDASEWRYGPSDTLIRADGCYAFRIQGEGFVDWVTLIARS